MQRKQMVCVTVIWFLPVNITHDIENAYADLLQNDVCALPLSFNEACNSVQETSLLLWFPNKSNKIRSSNASFLT